MRLRLIIAAFAFLLSPLFAGEAYACSCAGEEPPCQAYWEAAAVFVGTVTGSSPVMIGEGEQKYEQRLFRFSVEENHRGVKGAQAEVVTGLGDGDCGYGFKLGGRYLVYAYNSTDNKLGTGICSRTRPLSSAKEDLDYIRGLSNTKSGPTIYGEVVKRTFDRRESNDPVKPVVGAIITIKGQGKSLKTTTDNKGQYRFDGLPPGSYKVKLTPPKGLTIDNPEQEAKISGRGCAQVSFMIEAEVRSQQKRGRRLNSF